MKCFVCQKKLELLHGVESEPELACWGEGTVHKIQGGYGSCFDTHNLIVCICDSCTKTGIDNGLIVDRGSFLDEYKHKLWHS